MVVDMNDPESILRWWKVCPVRHDGYLEFELRTQPQFGPAILEAQRRIASDPALSALLAAGVQKRREYQATRARGNSGLQAHQLRYGELSLAA